MTTPNTSTGRRKPVPAGGAPTPATIEVADATPPVTDMSGEGGNAAAPGGQSGDADDATDAGAGEEAAQVRAGDRAADANAASDAPAPAPEPEPERDIDARVLIAFDDYDVNDVLTAPSRAVEALKLAGKVDPHPDAVAFARSA